MDTPKLWRAERGLTIPSGAAQALRFAAVGVSNTLVDAALYFALTRGALGLLLAPVLAKGLGYAAGVVNGYFWNRRWTFRSRAPIPQTIVPFVAVNLLGLALNAALLYLALARWGWGELPALAVATGVVMGWNFILNKCFVFKPR